MKLSAKEKSKIVSRKKLWLRFGWWWPFKKGKEFVQYDSTYEDGFEGSGYVKEMHKSSGIGYFRNNHSLNCGCLQCQAGTYEKKRERKRNRAKYKKEVMDYTKEYNTNGEID